MKEQLKLKTERKKKNNNKFSVKFPLKFISKIHIA